MTGSGSPLSYELLVMFLRLLVYAFLVCNADRGMGVIGLPTHDNLICHGLYREITQIP